MEKTLGESLSSTRFSLSTLGLILRLWAQDDKGGCRLPDSLIPSSLPIRKPRNDLLGDAAPVGDELGSAGLDDEAGDAEVDLLAKPLLDRGGAALEHRGANLGLRTAVLSGDALDRGVR